MENRMNRKIFLEHSSDIFYNMSIAFMILSYVLCVVFSFKLLGIVAMIALTITLIGVWVVIALIGLITIIPMTLPAFRNMLGDFAKFIFGLFNSEMTESIQGFLIKLSKFYPYIVAFAGVVTIIGITLNAVAHRQKSRIIALSIMAVFYVVSIILSALFINGLGGVK